MSTTEREKKQQTIIKYGGQCTRKSEYESESKTRLTPPIRFVYVYIVFTGTISFITSV